MQFKSIIAVLALAVAVAATPVEPVAVKLVARTTPTPTPAPTPPTVQNCPAKQVLLSKCSTLGVPLLTAANSSALLSLIQAIVQVGLTVSCVLSQVSLSNNNAICCTLKQGATTNTQNGLANVNLLQNVNILTCSPINVL